MHEKFMFKKEYHPNKLGQLATLGSFTVNFSPTYYGAMIFFGLYFAIDFSSGNFNI